MTVEELRVRYLLEDNHTAIEADRKRNESTIREYFESQRDWDHYMDMAEDDVFGSEEETD